jgi:hypothetical protein
MLNLFQHLKQYVPHSLDPATTGAIAHGFLKRVKDDDHVMLNLFQHLKQYVPHSLDPETTGAILMGS